MNVVQDISLSYCSTWRQQCSDRTSEQDRYAPRRARRGRLRDYFAILPEQLERLISETRERTLPPVQHSVIGSRLLPRRNFVSDYPNTSGGLMNIILVDDDFASLRLITGFCSMTPDVTVAGSFSDAEEAFRFAAACPPDAAILDIIMPVQDGITLADRLYEINPDILIFFATASEQYALSAFRRRAVSYITKPYAFSDILEALERAKLLCSQKQLHIRVRTFGHFDIFVNDTLLTFPRQKCKELLAFFVDRRSGAASAEQIIDALWEERYDDSVRAYFHVVLRDLKKTLKQAGIESLLICNRNQNAINPSMLDCDYYRFLDGDISAIREFNDEYMIDYSWAEPTVAMLMKKKQEFVQ